MNNGFAVIFRSIFRFHPVDDSHEGTLHDRLNPGRSRTLSHFNDVGADVRLRARFANLANEHMNAAEGDPVPVLN
jgi:hypothetical protein